MVKLCRIKNITQHLKNDGLQVKYCDNFFDKFIGLMFAKELEQNSGILMANENENIIDASIHMLFMNFDISVFWIDQKFTVVDKTIAQKWKLAYFPKTKAKYILEAHTTQFNVFNIGDTVQIDPIN